MISLAAGHVTVGDAREPEEQVHRVLSISPDKFVKRFLPYVDDTRSQQHFFGGAGSGKSVFEAMRVVLDLLGGRRNYLCMRKIANTLRLSIFSEIRGIVNDWKLGDYFSLNMSDLTVTCIPTQRQAILRGLDDPEKVKSARPLLGSFTDTWWEEATEFSSDDVDSVGFRLRGGDPSVPKRDTFTYNPIVHGHWIHTQIHGGGAVDLIDEPRLLVVKSTYRDNQFLTHDDIERYESKRKSKYHADVYLDGLWGNLAGVILTNWEVRDLSGMTFDRVRHGVDFGWNPDPAAYIQCAYQNNTIYILKELKAKGMSNQLLGDAISPMVADEIVWCDCAEPKSIAELRAHNPCVNARGAAKGKDSVRHGAQWLQQRKIVIDAKCIESKNEISAWQWEKTKSGDELPTPCGINDHLLAALRYALERDMSYRPMGALVTAAGAI